MVAAGSAEARLRAIVESSPSGLLMIDRTGEIVMVNREVERLFGYPREELVGHRVEMLLPEAARDEHVRFRAAYLRSPETRPMGAGRELKGLRKDGVEIPIEVGLTPVATADGILVLAAIVDIGARKRTDVYFRAAVESSPNGMIMVDPTGSIILVNREVERMFGYDRDALLGESVELLVPDSLRGHHPDHRADFLANPSRRSMGEGRDLYGVRRDGTEFPVEIGLNPIETEDGILVLSSVVDISARKRGEAERRGLEEQLRHSQKMQAMGTLAGGIAHDFNNILAAITTYAELLRDDSGTEQSRADANTILETCLRGKTIVDRILTFSRRQEAQLLPVSLTEVVREVETLLRATLPAHVDIVVQARGTDRVMADPSSLEQVIMNLATNGAQAMPDGGTLQFVVEPYYLVDSKARAHPTLGEGQYVALIVKDSGHGIDPDELERIFEPFFTTKEPGMGTGLGLAMVDNIVAEHGGAISIRSEPGKGTSVRCLFPALEPEWLTNGRSHNDARRVERGGGERILLVEDEPALAAAVDRRLEALGYTVRTFTDPREAREAFVADPNAFDLVLTDYTMPHLTGFDLADAIAAARPGLPILMVTGFVDDMDPGRVEQSAIEVVLRKPTTVEEMAAALARALGRV